MTRCWLDIIEKSPTNVEQSNEMKILYDLFSLKLYGFHWHLWSRKDGYHY